MSHGIKWKLHRIVWIHANGITKHQVTQNRRAVWHTLAICETKSISRNTCVISYSLITLAVDWQWLLQEFHRHDTDDVVVKVYSLTLPSYTSGGYYVALWNVLHYSTLNVSKNTCVWGGPVPSTSTFTNWSTVTFSCVPDPLIRYCYSFSTLSISCWSAQKHSEALPASFRGHVNQLHCSDWSAPDLHRLLQHLLYFLLHIEVNIVTCTVTPLLDPGGAIWTDTLVWLYTGAAQFCAQNHNHMASVSFKICTVNDIFCP